MRVLITGGTGSLGHALVRRWKDSAERIVVFSRDEWKQAEMARVYPEGGAQGIRYFLGDVRDKTRLEQALVGIDTVIHAAALKRVDAVAYNPVEVLKTNVLGTQNVIEAAVSAGVRQVVVVSSDKAVEPSNVYGSS
ncbi:MAG TPA: SDR family NAD(P)-dependent oxidoreductase, partial [Gemmatimonadales bacterium]|nr:SDR family NAD(P)-dependent oxidoreductase [Gemmatimonadales bacterium]